MIVGVLLHLVFVLLNDYGLNRLMLGTRQLCKSSTFTFLLPDPSGLKIVNFAGQPSDFHCGRGVWGANGVVFICPGLATRAEWSPVSVGRQMSERRSGPPDSSTRCWPRAAE